MRTTPYTARGITRVPCKRCGKPSVFQWRACVIGAWCGVCSQCDVELNALVLEFFHVPGLRRRLREYIARRAQLRQL